MNRELQERIEKLKDPKQAQPWGVLTLAEISIMGKAGKANMLTLYRGCEWKTPVADERFADMSYILKPNYEPDPEYIEIKVILFGGTYRLEEVSPNTACKEFPIITADKDFVCFHDPFGKETTNAGDVPGWMRTLAAQDGDIKMHARFEKS